MKHVIVVAGCHFLDESRYCDTAQKRLDAAEQLHLQLAAPGDFSNVYFVVTGDFPYQSGGITMGRLMLRHLIDNKNIPADIVFAGKGVDIYSEARLITREVSKKFGNKAFIHVISSDWHLLGGQLVWKYFFAMQRFDSYEFLPVEGTGGIRARVKSLICWPIFCAASFFGCINWLGARFEAAHRKRKEGFNLNGCA